VGGGGKFVMSLRKQSDECLLHRSVVISCSRNLVNPFQDENYLDLKDSFRASQ